MGSGLPTHPAAGRWLCKRFPDLDQAFCPARCSTALCRRETNALRAAAVRDLNVLMLARFDPSGKQPTGPPEVVMQTRIIGSHFVFIQYDMAPDGKCFLINSRPPGSGGPFALITNWTAALKK